jgi:2-keto-4-pentenoate hydratase
VPTNRNSRQRRTARHGTLEALPVADLDALAHSLLGAYASGAPIRPLTEGTADLTVDDAYTIQQIQMSHRIGSGAKVIGYKIGLTSAAMRQQMGVHEPDFGHLLTDMSRPADAPLPTGDFLQPRAEPEIALVLGRRLAGPRVSVSDIIAATDYAVAAIEIVDSRIADWKIGLIDTIADNASSGGFVLGQAPLRLDQVDLALTGCVLRLSGRIAATGAGAAVLGSPLLAATWLANELLSRGAEIGAGHIILTGSMTAAIPVGPGDAVTATFDRFGSVTAIFD